MHFLSGITIVVVVIFVTVIDFLNEFTIKVN